LLKSFIDYDENALSVTETKEEKKDGGAFFAKRLITGLAAEHYFEAIQPKLPEFKDTLLKTQRGLVVAMTSGSRANQMINFWLLK
jgi:hypothetical protein